MRYDERDCMRYFRGTILLDLDVLHSFPFFILSSFCDKLIRNDLNCTLSRIVNFLTQALTFVCALSRTTYND